MPTDTTAPADDETVPVPEIGPWQCAVPSCPVSDETLSILQMLANNGGSAELGRAAVAGIDTIWGYADNQEQEQGDQIKLAKKNIIVAIRAAVAGFELVAVEAKDVF